MWSVPPAGRRPRPPIRIRFELGHDVGERFDFGIGRNDQHLIFAGKAGDGRGLIEADRRFVGENAAHHDESRHHQHVAPPGIFVGELRQPHRAACPGNVLDRHRRGEVGALKHRLHRPGSLVPAAAGFRRRDDCQRLGGIGMKRKKGARGQGGDEARSNEPATETASVHVRSFLSHGRKHTQSPVIAKEAVAKKRQSALGK